MEFKTSDPDLETIVGRIRKGLIDLQPDFQRGEVWSPVKKKRLIDSILRSWHIPPIHMVARGGGKFDVLDGQQRLTAIRDFVNGVFAVDGLLEPLDPSLQSLNGLRYEQLPDDVRGDFDTFSIRVFELHSFTADEPYELFFRLNQPTNLTEAEKRNAFIGGPRNQVKELVEWAVMHGLNVEKLGFSNARMAYDDLIARYLLTLENRSFVIKITAGLITNRYRNEVSFDDGVIAAAEDSIRFYLDMPMLVGGGTKPNKATMHTWLCMISEFMSGGAQRQHLSDLKETIDWIESARFLRSARSGATGTALSIFHDRATARVGDVSSVVLRDLCAWIIHSDRFDVSQLSHRAVLFVQEAVAIVNSATDADKQLIEYATSVGWGTGEWI